MTTLAELVGTGREVRQNGKRFCFSSCFMERQDLHNQSDLLFVGWESGRGGAKKKKKRNTAIDNEENAI